MQIKCDFCGAFMNDTDDRCPSCGAENKHKKKGRATTPRTIEQLKDWYQTRNLPPYEKTRFFIGENYKGKRAFGIYKDGDEFIVYKNKDDGTRAIRYHGKDEAYAVNEIYLKLKSEIINQKSALSGNRSNSSTVSRSSSSSVNRNSTANKGFLFNNRPLGKAALGIWFALMLFFTTAIKLEVFFFLILIPVIAYFVAIKHLPEKVHIGVKHAVLTYLVFISLVWIFIAIEYSEPHYYQYDDDVYVSYYENYYVYDTTTYDYTPVSETSVPAEIKSHPSDYEYDSSDITWDSSYSFKESNYYVENLKPADSSYDSSSSSSSSSDSSWDWGGNSNYDWDSGSNWDSGYTNWGSNW